MNKSIISWNKFNESLNGSKLSSLKDEITSSVYMMVNHEDDNELADSVIEEIMKSISNMSCDCEKCDAGRNPNN